MAEDDRGAGFTTQVPDLSGFTLAELFGLDLDEEVQTVIAQVSKSRANLGGGGPPGRAD